MCIISFLSLRISLINFKLFLEVRGGRFGHHFTSKKFDFISVEQIFLFLYMVD